MARRFWRMLIPSLVVSMAMVAALPTDADARRASAVVMTRNVYLGADLTAAIGAPTPDALAMAAAESYVNVQATDFAERAKLLAEEIAVASPDLIGLQEVALWRVGPLETTPPFTPAETVSYDFLALLESELVALGLDYTTAVAQENFDVEAPASVTSTGQFVLHDVRLTMRNVILVRSSIRYLNAQSGHFDVNAVYPTVAGDLEDVRGWVSVDVRMGRRTFRFLNTHLDSYVTAVRTIQAQELIDGPLATRLKVVAVGDFNSPPSGDESEAYRILTSRSNGKMTDAWIAVNGDDAGLTCCQTADLLNPTSVAYTRIDLILTRTRAVKAMDIWVVGTTERTPGAGVWASDHFGVVATLSIP